MNNDIIQTFNLSKIYHLKGKKKSIKALNDINISVKKGEIFGLLGPNGAGKTTLIQILTTLLQPTSGYATIGGYNIIKKPYMAKSKLSLMLESDMLYYRITAYENLKFFCKIYGVKDYNQKIHELAKSFGLENWLNQYVENFSSGMKMRLALIRTLILERDLLFLDEPTLGLDVTSKSLVIDKLKDLKKTIFLTTHDMSVVEKLCDRIAFINEGNIVKIGTQNELKELMEREIKIEIEIKGDKTNLIKNLNSSDFVIECIEDKGNIVISIRNRDKYIDLLSILINHKITRIKELELSLEDLFIKLT